MPEAMKAGREAASKIEFGDTTAGKLAKEEWQKMKDTITKGFETGTQMVNAAKEKDRGADPQKILTQFSGSSSRVIADSLARVGGGGNYLRQGMTLQEKTQMEQLRAQQQGNEVLRTISNNTAQRPRTAAMAR